MKDRSTQKRPAPPLDNRRLRDLALHYVGRYATTKAKLASYLQRKIRERGWTADEKRPDLEALTQEFANLGYIDDAAYAASRARSFARRGYGQRRLEQDIYAAGISDADAADARSESAAQLWDSAHAFARRKRIGPYAAESAPPEKRQKQLAAFIRAGHDFDIARKFVFADPGTTIDGDDGA
ncbi:regulatory protein RecX [Sphingorhabdus arenilitoris]|uniref:Regulatory protein RecX n=1 Tax=Sphingorhabdus arenilitoris TaxID=1490041 RepID=A0ABV8RGE0_9SPHN